MPRPRFFAPGRRAQALHAIEDLETLRRVFAKMVGEQERRDRIPFNDQIDEVLLLGESPDELPLTAAVHTVPADGYRLTRSFDRASSSATLPLAAAVHTVPAEGYLLTRSFDRASSSANLEIIWNR